MLLNFTDEQLRQVCRTHIESLEKWARLLLGKVLTKEYGADFIHSKNPDGNLNFKKSLVEKADRMIADEPGRFPTPLDTLFLEDIVYLLTRKDIFELMKPTAIDFYPEGKEELRTFLERVIPIRNKLSHTNPFSVRDAERAVCYSNDFTDFVKQYFAKNNMEKEFNIPMILKVTDSLGNEKISDGKEPNGIMSISLTDPTTKEKKVFYKGEQFSVILEMDPSFPEGDYDINWPKMDGVEVHENGKKIIVTIGDNLIGEETSLCCRIVSHNTWHRYNSYDQTLLIRFKAIPL